MPNPPNFTSRHCVIALIGGALVLAVGFGTVVLRGQGGTAPGLKYEVVHDQFSSGDAPAATEVPDMLRQMVGELPEKNQTTYEWVRELQSMGFRVCVEDIRRRPLDRKISQFELRGNRELVQVLQVITQKDPRYRWDYVRGTDLVNVVPINDSRLTARMEPIHFPSRPLIECFVHRTLLDKAQIYPPSSDARSHPGNLPNWTFRVNMNGGTVRDYLNLLVRQYEGMTWSINCLGMVGIDAPEEVRTKISRELKRRADQRKANQTADDENEPADILATRSSDE